MKLGSRWPGGYFRVRGTFGEADEGHDIDDGEVVLHYGGQASGDRRRRGPGLVGWA